MAKRNGKKPKLKKTVLQLKQSSTPSDPSFLPSTKVDALSKTSSLFQPSPSTTTPSSISTPLLTLHFTSSSIQHATLSRIEAFYEGKPPLRERYLDLEQARREKLCRNYQAFNFPLGVVDRWLQGMKECWLGKRDGNFNFRGEDTKIDDGRISTKEADGNQSNTKDLKSGEDPTKDTATQSSRNEENRDEPKSEVSIDGTIQSGCSQSSRRNIPPDWWRSETNIYESQLLELLTNLGVIGLELSTNKSNTDTIDEDVGMEQKVNGDEEQKSNERKIDLKFHHDADLEDQDKKTRINGLMTKSNSDRELYRTNDETPIDPSPQPQLHISSHTSSSTSPNPSRTPSPIYLISLISSETPSLFPPSLSPSTSSNPTYLHELLHFLFHISPSYRSLSQSSFSRLSQKSLKLIKADMGLRGYREEVFVDEWQAYVVVDEHGGDGEFGNDKKLKEECGEARVELRRLGEVELGRVWREWGKGGCEG